jgi:hypothetical protein
MFARDSGYAPVVSVSFPSPHVPLALAVTFAGPRRNPVFGVPRGGHRRGGVGPYRDDVVIARRGLGFLAMSLVSLVTAHNLVFVLAFGPRAGDALAHTGHGDAWQAAVTTVLLAGAGLLTIALWRLHQLGLLTHRLEGLGPVRNVDQPLLGRDFVNLWARLMGTTAMVFVLQENVEHLASNLPLPGLGVLGSTEYPNALLVVGVVALAVALVGSLVRWRRAVLIARLRAGIGRLRRQPDARPQRPTDPEPRPGAILGRALAGRAPPVVPVT